ncbi:MAG TPA: HDOD domain-containing protein [Aminivibrio sp.]|jgi:putative nucleotidyltransferase with HDIG domain|uniref:HDOD domain-containing protein n=1 Tax=Aminivibrio sp. TaxID=1872489 RepID=UPI002C9A3031|nr:HDOD domain-containing protein [Aminivibrio sp.]NCB16438.1 HDOD domain-containing protein [Synergistales bacterium]HPF85009.1 HDOD domain-containing protein [Aminivibrio sp.]
MEYVSVSRLQSGMVLSGDLIAPNGRFILPKGARLTPKNIMSLKIWGVSEVPVAKAKDLEESSGEELLYSSSVMEEARNMVLDLFSGTPPASPIMEEVFTVAVRVNAARIAEGLPARRPETFSLSLPVKPSISDEKIDMEDILRTEVGLTSFPDVYFRVSEALQSPKSSVSHIADLISRDTALSATLLKLANSAIYGVPAKVDSISRATALIGGRALSVLALGVSAVQNFRDIPVEWVNMESFWKHSVSVAVIAQILASKKNPRVIEQAFVAGMLHDIGRLVLYRHAPFTMARLISASAERKIPLAAMEKEVLGFDHGELGGKLLERWNFPLSLSDMVLQYHGPEEQIKTFPSALLAAADIIAAAIGEGNSGSLHASPIPDSVWKVVDLPCSVIDMTARQAHRQITEIYSLFKGGDDDGKTVPHS